MKTGRRSRERALVTRLHRQLEYSADPDRLGRLRKRSARYAAALAEQLGLIRRPGACEWCRRRLRLERHHWDYDDPLRITYLCHDCHAIADPMVWRADSA